MIYEEEKKEIMFDYLDVFLKNFIAFYYNCNRMLVPHVFRLKPYLCTKMIVLNNLEAVFFVR